MAEIGQSETQYAKMIGEELRETMRIYDASRAKLYLENKVELSSALFPKRFNEWWLK